MSKKHTLEKLYETVLSRKGTDPKKSYSAKLFKRGRKKIAQKLGEEAAELIIEAIDDKKKLATSESADLLFHIIMLWADMGIKPKDVMKELEDRMGVSGIEEKENRGKE